MLNYKIAKIVRNFYSVLPAFRGKYRIVLLINKYLVADNNDYLFPGYDSNLLININFNSHIERHIFYEGYYEKETARLIKDIVKKDFICFDVGANVGVHTLLMAKYAEDGHVYCFEPFPPVYNRLIQNIKANRFIHVTAYPWAVGDENRETDLFVPDIHDPNQGVSSLYEQKYLAGSISVKEVKIDTVPELSNLPRLDLIKIDVEGYEPKVISSMKSLIEKHRPILMFEYAANIWKTELNDVLAYLCDIDYSFYSIEKGLTKIELGREILIQYDNYLCIPS